MDPNTVPAHSERAEPTTTDEGSAVGQLGYMAVSLAVALFILAMIPLLLFMVMTLNVVFVSFSLGGLWMAGAATSALPGAVNRSTSLRVWEWATAVFLIVVNPGTLMICAVTAFSINADVLYCLMGVFTQVPRHRPWRCKRAFRGPNRSRKGDFHEASF